jgi:predicted dehydrogenase
MTDSLSPVTPVIVGYGHAGRDLHHRCLRELAGRGAAPAGRVLAVDPTRPDGLDAGTRWLPTLAAALDALPSLDAAVFHVTTPVGEHLEVITTLLAAGASRIIVEKPLAHTAAEAKRIVADAVTFGARVVPVSVWPVSAVTERVVRLITSGRIGTPLALHMEQSKPRFRRSMADIAATCGHRSAFEVELPHQVLLALYLGDVLRLGPVEPVVESSGWPMRLPDGELPTMGGARVRLRHAGGLLSTLVTDLTSPIRLRRLRITGTDGAIVADYPISAEDDHGQIWVSGERDREVVADAPLSTFIARAYAYLVGDGPVPVGGLDSHLAAIELVESAAARALQEVGS